MSHLSDTCDFSDVHTLDGLGSFLGVPKVNVIWAPIFRIDLFISLKQSYREREKKKEIASICWFTLKWSHWPRVGLGCKLEPRTPCKSPTLEQGPKDLGHLLLLSQGPIPAGWIRSRATGTGTSTLIWDASMKGSGCVVPQSHPPLLRFVGLLERQMDGAGRGRERYESGSAWCCGAFWVKFIANYFHRSPKPAYRKSPSL